MLSEATFLDSRFRVNDRYLAYFVIPAKAGIQKLLPRLIEILPKKDDIGSENTYYCNIHVE